MKNNYLILTFVVLLAFMLVGCKQIIDKNKIKTDVVLNQSGNEKCNVKTGKFKGNTKITNTKDYQKLIEQKFTKGCKEDEFNKINFDKFFLIGRKVTTGACVDANNELPDNMIKQNIEINRTDKKIVHKIDVNKNRGGNACAGVGVTRVEWSLIPQKYSGYEVVYN